MRTFDHQLAEVAWYIKNGRYLDRLKLDRGGVPFVIGDYSWNQNNPDRREGIEPIPITPTEQSKSGTP